MTGLRLAACSAGLAVFLLAAPAAASQLTIKCDGVGGVIADGDAADLDDDADQIEVLFSCSQAQGVWTAEGRVFATVDAEGHGDLIVTETLIEKIAGDFVGGHIDVLHEFESFLTTPVIEAEVDGAYDHLSPLSVIGWANVEFAFYGYGDFIGAVDPPPAIGIPVPPDVPFAGVVGPTYVGGFPPSERVTIAFYLDLPGDAIRLDDSVHVSMVPEPGGAALVLACVALALGRRRRQPRIFHQPKWQT
jgi:MYXO-CTERM domain-containing protein